MDHSHDLPPPGKKGRTYICSCMLFLRPTSGAKKVMKQWIEEMQLQPWSTKKKSNDQPAFNWALNKTHSEVGSLIEVNVKSKFDLDTVAGRLVPSPSGCFPLWRTLLQERDVGQRNQWSPRHHPQQLHHRVREEDQKIQGF